MKILSNKYKEKTEEMPFEILDDFSFSPKLRSRVFIELCGEVEAICPINEEYYKYKVIIRYVPFYKLIEILSFKKYLKNIGNRIERSFRTYTYHEEIAEKIYRDIKKYVKPLYLVVEVTEDSPGIQMRVKIGKGIKYD